MNKQDHITELLTRGVSEVIGKEDLERKLRAGTKLRIKLGIDPTSPNLHIGRAVLLLKLRDLQQLGHTIVLIIGDFTGVIGDTSDKDSERPMLTAQTIKQNLKTYKAQAEKLLDIKKVEFHYNSSWLKKLDYMEIGEQADQFSLAEFISRENIKKRLDAGKRISLREVLYPLMQGYDSVMVKSDVEVGGTDQRFNMLAGRTLQQHYKQLPQNIIMTNLILGTDGRKMSSSWGNTINLMDGVDDMYGKVMSIPDNLIISYFILCTRVPMNEIFTMESEMKKNTLNPRDAKMRLAREIVILYNNKKAAQEAEKKFIALFQKKEVPDEMPIVRVAKKEWSIIDLLVETKLASSKSEARRVIEQGGVSIDEKIISDVKANIAIPSKGMTLKKGKRHFVKIVR